MTNINDNDINIEEILIGIVNNILPEPVDHSELLNNIELRKVGLNSIGSVKLLVEIEKVFNIEIPDHFLNPENFNNISIIKDVILKSIKKQT